MITNLGEGTLGEYDQETGLCDRDRREREGKEGGREGERERE